MAVKNQATKGRVPMLGRNPRRCLLTFSILLLLGAGGISALMGQTPGAEERKEAKRIDLCNRDALPSTGVKFKNPDMYLAKERGPNDKGDIVSVNLEMNFTRHAIDQSLDRKIKDFVRLRSYNGGIVGPVIRVSPGDRLKIKLQNGIAKAEPDTPPSSKNPNAANGFNITNLHTHGLHVSPAGWADNIFKEIGPGETAEFCYDIPADHPAGTFWYHPHRHGSTGVQVASGMAGALIVDGGMDEVPEIKEAMRAGREKILLFQQITYSIGPNQQVGEVLPTDIYRPLVQRTTPLPGGGLRVANTAINGELLPDMTMVPGEIQRWRCIHAGTNTSLNLAILDNKDQPLWLHELARDGLALPQITPQKNIVLHPGYRSDFLVQAPPAPGEYFLVSGKIEANNSIADKDQVLEYLARVIVQGEPVNMKLPAPDAIKKYALPSIPDAELLKAPPRTIHFYKKILPEKKILTVNGKMFNDDPPPEVLHVRLGTAEEWHLSSEGEGGHPFHIHVNPFEVIEKNPSDGIQRYWRDTIWVPVDKDNPVVIRTRFETFPGKTVLHCHSLDHEDQGMMSVVQIDGDAPPSRCDPKRQTGLPSLPAKAPGWTLRDSAEKLHRLKDFGDRDVLLVFFRGLACPHCRSQLEALAKRRQALAKAKLTVVAICPDSCEELRNTLRDDLPPDALPFLILSDPFLEAFRGYGCHDGRALHGTFLIDAEGMVRWQEVGDEPFMDIDRLLDESKRLHGGHQP
jgi:FtsP/CotA-like multicopper oxidase with cupredoxin domain/peroxiredoxin